MISNFRVDKPLLGFRYTHDVYFLEVLVGQATEVRFAPDKDFNCHAFICFHDTTWGKLAAVLSEDVRATVWSLDPAGSRQTSMRREPCLTAQPVQIRMCPCGDFELVQRDVPVPVPGVDQDVGQEDLGHLKQLANDIVAW